MHTVKVNDLVSCFQDGFGNEGKQHIETEGQSIPLLHDGLKYFLKIREPTDVRLETYPVYELTSPLHWNPKEVLMSIQCHKQKTDEFSDVELMNWSECLGGIPNFLVKNTLAATAQFVNTVEAETRTTPQHHYKVCLQSLRPCQCQEGFFSETFFSDTKLTRGYECGQIFVGANSSFTYVDMMKGKGYAPNALKNFIWDAKAPAYIHHQQFI